MLEYLVVALIVGVAAWYAASRYLPKSLRDRLFGKKKASSGCGSGCSSCGSCGSCVDGPTAPLDAVTPPGGTKPRVIQVHLK